MVTTLESPDISWSYDVYSVECPTRDVLDRLGSRWTGLTIVVLAERPHHFGELRRRIHGISKKMLVQTLRALERDGMLSRTVVEDTYPPMVRYALTDLGSTLVDPLRAIHDWAEAHMAAVTRSRDEYDAAAGRRSQSGTSDSSHSRIS